MATHFGHEPSPCSALDTVHRRGVGKGSRLDHAPLTLEVEFVSRSDVRFELKTNKATSTRWCVIIETCARAQSSATAAFDLGQGVAVKKLNVVFVKATVAHRAAYDPITARSLTADTTGLCSGNLKRLPYQQPRISA